MKTLFAVSNQSLMREIFIRIEQRLQEVTRAKERAGLDSAPKEPPLRLCACTSWQCANLTQPFPFSLTSPYRRLFFVLQFLLDLCHGHRVPLSL